MAMYSGSPPRVREPLAGTAELAGAIGITPACAGTTLKDAKDALEA